MYGDNDTSQSKKQLKLREIKPFKMPSTALIKLYLLINLISCIMILVIETVDKMDTK